jgi:tRNA(Leu) C34 or U34 (ribose-2'-O)-methylase TrmL
MMRGYACIALDNPKVAANVGSVIRAAGVYRARMVVLAGERTPVRACTDTMKAYRHMPVLRVADVFNAIPYDCVPVAVDLLPSARPLPSYVHPERAFYVFGAEDATLGKRITERCRDVIYVPTERCMNLAACVNVVLYDRLAKEMRAAA